jgi:uncharacterized protein involved in exopolysaccharide biosynthesis
MMPHCGVDIPVSGDGFVFLKTIVTMQQEAAFRLSTDEIGLRDLVAVAWASKWAVIAIVLVFTVLGAVAGSLIVKQYRAEILISPVSDSGGGPMGGLGGIASQYSGLASLAGLSLGRGGSNKDESIAVLQSELITDAFVRSNDLLPVLFPKNWDANAKKWISTDPKKVPTLWMANQYFKKIRDVKQEKTTGLVTLRITWRDPIAAARWANQLVLDTNKYLRDKAITESERNIQYLNIQAANTNIVEARTAIFSILKDEVNKQMIAKGREEYALKVLDPAQPPERPSSPSPLLVTVLGFVAGCLFAGLYVFFGAGKKMEKVRRAARP